MMLEHDTRYLSTTVIDCCSSSGDLVLIHAFLGIHTAAWPLLGSGSNVSYPV